MPEGHVSVYATPEQIVKATDGGGKFPRWNSPETIISTFIEFLARVRAMFREVHLFAEMDPRLHSVTTAVIPFKTKPLDYADDGLTTAVALNAELVKWEDRNRKAIGMSLLLRRSGGMWCAEGGSGLVWRKYWLGSV